MTGQNAIRVVLLAHLAEAMVSSGAAPVHGVSPTALAEASGLPYAEIDTRLRRMRPLVARVRRGEYVHEARGACWLVERIVRAVSSPSMASSTVQAEA